MGFMRIITATSPKIFTIVTTFSDYILIVSSYLKLSKLYCVEIITTEEVMDKLDMFQDRFGKNRLVWMVGFGNIFRRCRYAVYLHGFPVRI